MAEYVWLNTGSGDGLLPNGPKQVPEPVLTNHQWGSVTFTWEQFYSEFSNVFEI